ncbi:hypothetical protein U5801_06580 [Lamprobacter modestohalophilus]|uniref:hypothetical protein n=1 Tax=Lamprobacter modestohalophilus TaxID=1064514 RepID=UPI002ADEE270|nr:hypothetical protein [Lamprobacter modestohalophilus]MEA1049468.1 hypothetical protein [Lamprobacter modestohalophilus]
MWSLHYAPFFGGKGAWLKKLANQVRGYFLIGARFVAHPPQFIETIGKLIEHQIKYFTQPF